LFTFRPKILAYADKNIIRNILTNLDFGISKILPAFDLQNIEVKFVYELLSQKIHELTGKKSLSLLL
jgi:hypothetical protein